VNADSTFHLRVTDCQHEDHPPSVEDVYVDGVALNGPQTGRAMLRSKKGPTVVGVAYLSRAWVETAHELCFQAMGGNMAGFSFKSNVVKLPI
jgi:hypothetical protein